MRRSRLLCYLALIGLTLICCGQLSLLVWVDSSHTSRETFSKLIYIEILNKQLQLPVNSPPAYSHLGSNMPSTELLKNLPEYQYTMSSDASRKVVSETSTSTNSPDAITEEEIEPVRVEEIKNLYDSDVILSHGVKKTKWIRNRMMAMANTWDKAAHNLSIYKPSLFLRQKKILLLPGLMVDKLCPKCRFAENALKGGPVGELVQWTDLIVSLFMLGHNITIITTDQQLAAVKGEDYDVIISDYIGLRGLQGNGILPDYYCRVRVLDTFGSEPLEIFNATDYMPEDTHPYFRRWKFQNTKQFWNLYPHTPDNSFLGFAMEMPEQVHKEKRENTALIYGKKDSYMVGKENYLAVIGAKLELHSTFKYLRRKIQNTNIINHGIVDHSKLSGLLQSSKLFIGLGFPYEGPGPLEALANGCPYIQPKFIPPRGRKNEKFFKSKPTTRIVTSQNPYMEDYVGEPYVFTVDADNMSAVKEVVDKVMERGDLPPYIPYEFTQQGMMVRVGAYIIYQDFCRGNSLTGSAAVSVSSFQPDHPATHAIDDDPKGDTCYHSNISSHSWWQADLGSEKFIREIIIQLENDTLNSSESIMLSLRDSAGFNKTHELVIENGSLLLNWTNIETMARHVRIDVRSSAAVPDQLTLCKVDIYGTSTFWPKPSLMKVVHSEDDESCNAACNRHHLLCEHSFFPLVNSFKVLDENFNCKSMKETTKYMNIFPSYILSDDKDNEFETGTCVTTKINSLLSCNGGHQGYLRLCPCRQYRKGQVALPIEL